MKKLVKTIAIMIVTGDKRLSTVFSIICWIYIIVFTKFGLILWIILNKAQLYADIAQYIFFSEVYHMLTDL